MNALTQRFYNKISTLSSSEKYVFYYIDENIEKAKIQGLVEMSDATSVSTATVVRMCRKLGLSGFSELKHVLKDLDKNNVTEKANFFQELKSSIEFTIDNIDEAALKKLVYNMRYSKKIVIVSVGLTKSIGEYFSKLLMQANKNTFYIYESHIIDLLPRIIDTDDLVIFISNSGKTQTLLSISEKLSYGHYKTCAIVNSSDAPISKFVNITISSASNTYEYGGYDITPRSSLMVIIDLIFALYLESISKKK